MDEFVAIISIRRVRRNTAPAISHTNTDVVVVANDSRLLPARQFLRASMKPRDNGARPLLLSHSRNEDSHRSAIGPSVFCTTAGDLGEFGKRAGARYVVGRRNTPPINVRVGTRRASRIRRRRVPSLYRTYPTARCTRFTRPWARIAARQNG